MQTKVPLNHRLDYIRNLNDLFRIKHMLGKSASQSFNVLMCREMLIYCTVEVEPVPKSDQVEIVAGKVQEKRAELRRVIDKKLRDSTFFAFKSR